jgi:hypothetical protein
MLQTCSHSKARGQVESTLLLLVQSERKRQQPPKEKTTKPSKRKINLASSFVL